MADPFRLKGCLRMPVLLSAAKIPVELASFRPGCALPAGRPEPVAALGRFAGAPKDEKRKFFGQLSPYIGGLYMNAIDENHTQKVFFR